MILRERLTFQNREEGGEGEEKYIFFLFLPPPPMYLWAVL